MAFGDFECRVGPWLPVGGVVVAERWPCDDRVPWAEVEWQMWTGFSWMMGCLPSFCSQGSWSGQVCVESVTCGTWTDCDPAFPPPPQPPAPRHFLPQTILKERLCSTLGWAVYSIHEPYIVLLRCVLFDWPPWAELLFAQHHWHFQVGFDG